MTITNNQPLGPSTEDFLNMAHGGMVVIPLKPRDKVPLQKNWQNNDIPTDNEINTMLKKYPTCNMGLVTGVKSGVVALDIDGNGGEELLADLSCGNLPDTWEYKTPGGGRRLLYGLPQGASAYSHRYPVPNGNHEELALMGDGQQVVLPPSIHPNGEQYNWLRGHEPWEIDLVDAPDWLLNRMSSRTKRPLPSELFRDLASRCPLFDEDLALQRGAGLDENNWFLWVSLLVAAEYPDEALAFSLLSKKHSARSEERLEKLTNEGKRGMVRCARLGCNDDQIIKCHKSLRTNDKGEPTNSPGAFLKQEAASNEEVEHVWPTAPIYEPYVNMMRDTPYRLDEQGNLLYEGEKKNVPISNFVTRATKEIVRDDGVTTEQSFVIEGVLSGGRPLEPITVHGNSFAAMSWPLSKWGIKTVVRPGFSTKDHLRAITQLLSTNAERETVYTHLGWREVDGKWVFLHYGGCIGASNVTVDVDKALLRYRLPERTCHSTEAAEASLALLHLAPLDITIPLLSLVYLSPLCEPLRMVKLEPNFLLWFFGITGSRKTSLAMVFLSHFGDFVRGSPPASFKDQLML
ncbi:MAG: hypothetical protein FD169_1842 [Bacillota bacterium]|nr:MAG: hypothetical protein FD169_1842 [Bacillota bacterium]